MRHALTLAALALLVITTCGTWAFPVALVAAVVLLWDYLRMEKNEHR